MMKKVRYTLDVWVSSKGEFLSAELKRRDMETQKRSTLVHGFSGTLTKTKSPFGDEFDSVLKSIRLDLGIK